jgi:hypothetical protein
VLLVDRSELYRAVRPSYLGTRISRGVALDVQELGHRVATEVADAFEALVGSRDEIPRVVLGLDDLDDLDLRSLHVQLQLRVLVGRPHDGVRRRAFTLLAQRLCPELNESCGEPI